MNAYDFDDTIYDGQSTIDFFYYYIKKNPQLMVVIPSILKTVFMYKREKVEFDDFKRKYSKIIKDYFDKNEVDILSLVSEFWDEHEHKVKDFYKDIQREDDVIITASPVFLMEEIGRRIGIKNIIGSEFNPETGEIGRACFREEKPILFSYWRIVQLEQQAAF